jgi:mono/diheme cytochrome c family protein
MIIDAGSPLSKEGATIDNSWLRSSFQNLLLSAPLLCLSALVLCACNASGAKPRPLTEQEQRGRDVYASNCAQCHNAYKREPLQGPPLVGLFKKEEMPSGIPATDRHVRDTILTGRRNMPPFNQVLDDNQLTDLMSFLHTL